MEISRVELFQKEAAYKVVVQSLAAKTLEMYSEADEAAKEALREEMAALATQRDELQEDYVACGGDLGQLEA